MCCACGGGYHWTTTASTTTSESSTTTNHTTTESSTTESSTTDHTTTESSTTFFLVEGDCTASGGCVRSANYPDSYGNIESCTITFAQAPVWFTPTSFATESQYDKITVDDSAEYDGQSWTGHDPFEVTSSIRWTSDESQGNSGWEFCVTTAYYYYYSDSDFDD
jgi:hypothetical protein